jgi:hypothetical protein
VGLQDEAKSSNSSKNSNSSDVSPLKVGALLDPGLGIADIPLFFVDMVEAGIDEHGFWMGCEVEAWTTVGPG